MLYSELGWISFMKFKEKYLNILEQDQKLDIAVKELARN